MRVPIFSLIHSWPSKHHHSSSTIIQSTIHPSSKHCHPPDPYEGNSPNPLLLYACHQYPERIFFWKVYQYLIYLRMSPISWKIFFWKVYQFPISLHFSLISWKKIFLKILLISNIFKLVVNILKKCFFKSSIFSINTLVTNILWEKFSYTITKIGIIKSSLKIHYFPLHKSIISSPDLDSTAEINEVSKGWGWTVFPGILYIEVEVYSLEYQTNLNCIS